MFAFSRYIPALTSCAVLGVALMTFPSNNFPVTLMDAAYAQDDGGNGSSGGGGSGSGGGSRSGVYSDLVFVLRNTQGLPILDINGCVQPVSPEPVLTLPTSPNPVVNPADGRQVSLIPLVGTSNPASEEEACDVWTTATGADQNYTEFTEEILFGRLNIGRAPDIVLDNQLDEVTQILTSAATITLDAAGRLVADNVEVDSPPINLAIHKQLMLNGEVAGVTLPAPANDGWLDHASATLGAAAGKEDPIGVDLVVYNNRIIGIPAETQVLSTIAGSGGANGTGEAGEAYIDYDAAGYTYDRFSTYPGCMNGLIIDYDNEVAIPFSGTVVDCVFGDGEFTDGGTCTASASPFTGLNGVHSFATRADDARRVNAFIHDSIVFNVDPAGQSAVCGDTRGLEFDKSATPAAFSAAGEFITYSFTLRNNDTFPYTNLVITDAVVGGEVCRIGSLWPGVSTSCTAIYKVTDADVAAGGVVNTANLVADELAEAKSATFTIVKDGGPGGSDVTFDKSASPKTFSGVGEIITYTFTVANNSAETLTNIVVTDPELGGTVCASDSLSPSYEIICTAAYTTTDEDVAADTINNTAIMSADQTTDATASETVVRQ